jgi:hypothetical protein
MVGNGEQEMMIDIQVALFEYAQNGELLINQNDFIYFLQ